MFRDLQKIYRDSLYFKTRRQTYPCAGTMQSMMTRARSMKHSEDCKGRRGSIVLMLKMGLSTLWSVTFRTRGTHHVILEAFLPVSMWHLGLFETLGAKSLTQNFCLHCPSHQRVVSHCWPFLRLLAIWWVVCQGVTPNHLFYSKKPWVWVPFSFVLDLGVYPSRGNILHSWSRQIGLLTEQPEDLPQLSSMQVHLQGTRRNAPYVLLLRSCCDEMMPSKWWPAWW